MKNTTWFCGALTGGIVCATLILACSDDSPSDADAAVCDCPAAEPPLAGRITSVTDSNPITAGATGGASVYCPVGATVLGGACNVGTDDPAIQVQDSQFLRDTQQGYLCRWSALDATVNNTGTVEAICLVAAQ